MRVRSKFYMSNEPFKRFRKVAPTAQERTIHVGTRTKTANISRRPARGLDIARCHWLQQFCLWIFSSMHHNHRRRSRASASPVLTAIGLVNGKPYEPVIFDPPQNRHTLTDR